MKYPIVPMLLVTLLQGAQAQTQSNEGQPSSTMARYKSVTIRLENNRDKETNTTQSQFSHFEVIDERPDTARIGIHTDLLAFARLRNRTLVLDLPASAAIAQYLNKHCTNPRSPYTALIVIRHLWLSDANFVREGVGRPTGDEDRYKTKLSFRAECYAEKGQVYTPLLRYDSAHYALKGSFHEMEANIRSLLEDMAGSASALLDRKADRGRMLSREDIQAWNRSRFDIPVTRDAALVPGVYSNFEEFRNNQPSIHSFEIRKEGDNSVLYLKDNNGNSYYSHNSWGYCDGKNVFIMRNGALVPAWREGNAWYVYSRAVPTANSPDAANAAAAPAASGTPFKTPAGTATPYLMVAAYPVVDPIQKHIYTVDMDTGKLL